VRKQSDGPSDFNLLGIINVVGTSPRGDLDSIYLFPRKELAGYTIGKDMWELVRDDRDDTRSTSIYFVQKSTLKKGK